MRDGGQVGAAAAQRGDAAVGGLALESGDDDDVPSLRYWRICFGVMLAIFALV